jgi:opacity protein-like surface antigen
MKKIIIAVSMLAATFVANAQEPTLQPTRLYKPVAGNVLAEIGFLVGGVAANPTSLQSSPFSSGTTIIPQLKFRYFLQDQIALRVGFNFTQNSNTTKIYEAGGSGTGFARDGYSLFGLNAGLEKHFTGTGRLSTYVGADVLFQKVSAASKWDNTADGTTFSDGDTRKTRGFNTATPAVNSSFGFGLRAVAGADYYFVEKVYLGAEFGWGFIASKDGKTKDEKTVGGVTTTVETKSTGGSFNLAPMITGGLRLGFIF